MPESNLSNGITAQVLPHGILLTTEFAKFKHYIFLNRPSLQRLNDLAIVSGFFEELPHPKPDDSLEI
jgi:hypothetical protein